MRAWSLIAISIGVAACATDRPPANPPSAMSTAATPASSALHALFASEWDHEMQEWPTRASSLGDHRFDDRWPDVSPAGFERRAAHARELQARVHAIDPAPLSSEDRLSLELLSRQVDVEVEGEPYRLWHLVLDQREGIQTADDLSHALRFATPADYDAWIARLRAVPAYVDGAIATMRQGVAEHVVQPRVVMERVPAQIAQQLVTDPGKSPFFYPFQSFAPSIPQADRDRLVQQARDAISSAVVPAYRRLGDYFSNEYLPACFPDVGAWQLPKGADAYAYLVRLHTTTKMTPEQVHDTGLREVARIRGQMIALMARTGFKGALPDFFAWLRTDPQFFYPDARSLFAAYQTIGKRIDPLLVTEFRTLPRTPYQVEPIPEASAPDTTTAYYREPAADGSRPGTYFVNLYKPEARPKWEMMALSLHESVPGHHLQIALASEQTGLPDFRRHESWTAYVEGWGLYAESLGDDMGLYDDPYSKFGQLAYEMWRAVRLVVDTGMHAMHWSRQQAIDYFLANAPKTQLDVVNEIDRYIAWPGQALAYKIGQLEILRLRDKARAELGARFDVKDFHDVVLRDGAMPLDLLESRVDAWIARTRG